MTAKSPVSSPPVDWIDVILAKSDSGQVWESMFSCLRELALANPGANGLHRETILPDQLLAESAWNLWEDFPQHAPRVVDDLKRFWVTTSSFGSAILILDALSLRELPLLVAGAEQRGLSPVRINVRASQVPTETDQFAAALGLPSRSKLYNNQPPGTFIFAGPDVHTDVLDAPFADCIASVPSKPRLFLWHKWPDEPLIHLHQDKDDGPAIVAEETKKQLASDGFWSFVDHLRQGRRLVITGDHGYADSKQFSSEVKDEESIRLLREYFGAQRSVREPSDRPWPRQNLPPLVCRYDGWLVLMGQRKWKVQGRKTHLCHRGLTLLEAAVPLIEFPPK